MDELFFFFFDGWVINYGNRGGIKRGTKGLKSENM